MTDFAAVLLGLKRGLADHDIPASLQEGIMHYVMDRRATGSFLAACFSNDFGQAAYRADPQNATRLASIGIFIRHCTPPACHGSPEKVAAWVAGVELTGDEADLIETVDVTEQPGGAPATGPSKFATGGQPPPGVDDVQGPDHPGGTEEDA